MFGIFLIQILKKDAPFRRALLIIYMLDVSILNENGESMGRSHFGSDQKPNKNQIENLSPNRIECNQFDFV